MDVIVDRCAGVDVHLKTVVACVRTPGTGRRKRDSEVRTFDTFTDGLVELRDWLVDSGVTEVAMEATGVYWKPVWDVLEGHGLSVLLANPAHIKNVPGRKTDVDDATWIGQLLECGLLRGSFVPPVEIRRLREITRYRRQLTEERSREVQRLQKLLEDAGVKLSAVASRRGDPQDCLPQTWISRATESRLRPTSCFGHGSPATTARWPGSCRRWSLARSASSRRSRSARPPGWYAAGTSTAPWMPTKFWKSTIARVQRVRWT